MCLSPKHAGVTLISDGFELINTEATIKPIKSNASKTKSSKKLKYCAPVRVPLDQSLSFKSLVQDQGRLASNSFNGRDGLVHKQVPALSLPEPEFFFSPRPESELQAAAVKVQKVYKSYRTRRNLADCAVVVEELWWKALDFAALERSSVSFFNGEKPETAVSRWARARTRAAKVGKGLSKDEKAQKLALQHWLEAIDTRHRYGHNLHLYYDVWFKSESLGIDHTACGTGLQGSDLIQAQHLLIDELKHLMKGNVELVCHDSSGPVANWNGNAAGDVVAVSNNQDEHFEHHPNAIKECRGVGQLQLDEETLCQNKKISSEVSKPVDNCEESSLSRTNGLEVNNEIQQKEIQPDKSVCADASMGYPPHMIEDGEIEEREVSGQFEVDDGSVDMFSEVAVVPQEKKVDEKQASEAIIDKNRLPINEKNEANKKDSWFSSLMADTVENAKDRREVEAQQRFSSEMACKRKVVTYEDPILAEEGVWCKKQKKCHGVREQNEGSAAKDQKRVSRVKEQKKGNVANDGAGCPVVCPNNLALFTENSDQTASANQGIASKEKDAGLCSKKKRGPPSKEKKAKKKGKERKKRAEKNRQLGVKRLKLLPVLNLKPKSHCRHFLKGRCREGQKCKFSHDAIPLTKFEPCHHFARHKCMKGDNCPYDHQLSKYPCTNYASKGYCIRGESCMFSHKVPLQEDLSSTSNVSNVCTPKVKPPSLPSTSNSKRQPDISGISNQTAKALPDSTGVISDDRHAALNVAKTAQNLPAPVPKGFSFLSGGKKSMVESSPKPSSPSLKSNVFIKVGNQIDQCASVTVQNCNEIPRKTPSVVAPKGINFLSFGKAPLDKCSSTMKLKSLAINRGNGVHLFSSKSFNVQEEASSSSNKDNSVLAGKGSQQSVSNVAHGLNKMLQKTESTAFQDASTDSLRRNPQAVHASVQESKIASNKHIESSAPQERLPASPLGSGQSSDQLALGCLKNKPLSTQKALMSTLAFAAKIESLMKMNQSTSGALAVSSMVSKQNRDSTTPRGLQIDSEKASKLLDFLSGIGGETKK